MKRKSATTIWASLLAVILLAVCAWGQTPSATLSGVVRDASGAVVPGARITLKSISQGTTRRADTDNEGRYILANVEPGLYDLLVEHSGFSRTEHKGVDLTVGAASVLDFTLKVGDVNEVVDVTDKAPLIETTKAELSRVVDTQSIESLPIAGRNFVDFTKLSSSVTPGRENLGGGAFKEPDTGVGQAAAPRLSFGGQPELNTMILVDGAENVQTFTGLPRVTPSQESAQEFRILNNTYAAEYGHASGGFVNILTKSGTNDLHGAAYYFGMNQALNQPYALNPADPRLQQNQYGANLGGPLVKDETFFFLNYEGQRRAQTNQYSTVILNNIAGINATKAFFGLSPENFGLLHTNDYDGILGKLDHKLSSNNFLSFRYNLLNSQANGFLGGNGRGSPTPTTARNNSVFDQSLIGSLTTVVGPHIANEARLQWSRRNFNFPSALNEPDLEVPDLLLSGKSTSDVDFYRESGVEGSNSLSIISGAHQIKIGGDVNYSIDTYQWNLFFPARVIFPDFTSFLGQGIQTPGGAIPLNGPGVPIPLLFWWPFLNGTAQRPALPVPFTQNVPGALLPDTFSGINHGIYGVFAQDQWQATHKLTLTYGLRYDLETYPQQYVQNAPRNGFQPRLGFAYALTPRTVARGGAGLFDGRLVSSIGQSLVTGQWDAEGNLPDAQALAKSFGYPGLAPLTGRFPDAVQIVSLPGVGFSGVLNDVTTFTRTGQVPCINPLFAPTTACPAGTPPSLSPFFGIGPTSSLKIPYTEQASLQISHELGGGIAISASYLYVHGIHQGAISGSLNTVQTGTFDGGKACFALGGPVGGVCNPGLLTPTANKFLDLGNLFAVVDSGGSSVYHGGSLEIEKRFTHGFSLHGNYTYSRTISNYESVANIADIPQTPDRNLERAASRQSIPQRFTLTFLSQVPKSMPLLHDFRFSTLVNAQAGGFYNVFAGQDFNDDGNPLSDRPGTLSRDTLKGPGIFSWDMRIARNAHFTERLVGEFTFDLFNVTNRTNVSDLNTVCECDNASTIKTPGALNPLFGFDTARATLNPFQFQYGFKLHF